MSTEKKRPQLNPDELQQLRWLLGGLAALTGAWAVAFLEMGAGWLLAGITALVALVVWKPALPARVPAWLHRLVFPVIVAVTAYDLYTQGEVLPAMTRLALLLLAYRAISYRRGRDELQLVVLGLFLVVVAGVLTVSMGFAVQILGFAALALAMLMAMTLSETGPAAAHRAGQVPTWAENVEWRQLMGKLRRVADWRLAVLGGLLFAGVAVLSGLLFLAIPRFELGSSLFLEGLINRKSRSGFTDTLKFGDVADILRDESVAMRVEVPDRARLPAELYWRMVVLDDYRESAFRVSAGLKAVSFGQQRTSQRVNGNEPRFDAGLTCTFYLEAGTGRYLPLTGGFRSLVFTEPQSFRASANLRVVELAREPMSMKAYRVNGMAAQDTLRDPGFARWIRLPDYERRASSPNRPTMLEVNLSEPDRAVLREVVAEITGGANLSPEAFTRKTTTWLGARHSYALSMELPKGAGDPLVRWIVSTEPGHCELFAGAFTVLARMAGHPARVVGGFVGGAWNEDYLIVRNSDAHAWCEIFDEKESWVRVDPTAAAQGGGAGSAVDALTGGAGVREAVAGWGARMDRLRLFWYRHIVNFEQRDQRVLAESIKDGATGAGLRLKETGRRILDWIRGWVTRPWSVPRAGGMCGGVAGALVLWLFWRRKGRAWWLGWRSRHRRGDVDPVRREAGRWLVKLAQQTGEEAELSAVREGLQRLRYGSRETWPPTATLWQRARRLSRKRRG